MSGALYALALVSDVRAQAAGGIKQAVLGPGLYVYQTRVRGSTCGDAEPDGYVLSYVASIDGVPGSTTMSMELVNTKHFGTWTLTITPEGKITGTSRIGSAANGPETRIELELGPDKSRFKGTGLRSYDGKRDGKPQRCEVSYDTLLRRIDV